MVSQLPPDPYAELSVAKDAKLPEIRSAYRKLVLKHHPDKVRDDTSKSLAEKIDAFQKVQQAYELLSDDNRRMRYDEEVKLFELRKEMGRFPRQPRTNLFAYEERKPKEEELPSRLWNIFDEYAYPRSTRTEERRREERRDERQREERRRERRAEEIRATKSYLFSPASREERRKERRREERRDERQREESRRERQAEEIRATKSYLFSPANREERRKERPERDERVPSSAYVEVETTRKIYVDGGFMAPTHPSQPTERPLRRSNIAYSSWQTEQMDNSVKEHSFFPSSFLKGPTPVDYSCGERRGKSQKDFIVEQRGIKVLIKNRKDSAFGDTGAGQNVISDRRRQELGLEMRPDPTSFPMGNSKRIYSPGTVEFPLAFEDDPTNIMTIVAHVVHNFAYDLLLGNPFLQATKCLTKFKHRFVRCLFSVKSLWSFNLLGETTQRFQGRLGKGVPFLGLPDIGSARNVMDAGWAEESGRAAGFKILSGPENCGWILFPDGTEEATIGQAHTTMTLPDGKVVPIIFELLRSCHVPVVLGQDFIFDHDIYTRYATSIMEFDDLDSGDELMPMGFRWNRSEGKRSGTGASMSRPKPKDDLEQQLDWNIKYQDGRTAPVDEWNLEYSRRERYELSLNPNWRRDPRISLIEHKPKALRHHPTQSPTQQAPASERNSVADESSDTSSSFQSGVSTARTSSDQSNIEQDDLVRVWNVDPYYSDSIVSGERAQWQAERPL